MNDLSTVINRGGGGLKENPPCTPLKEDKGRNSLFTEPEPEHIAHTRAHAQGTRPANGSGSGSGSGCNNNLSSGSGSGSGSGSVQRRPTVDAELILHGYHAMGRYDAVQTAMYVFNIPLMSNGYNNARILRYYLRRLGEEEFRQIVYEKWRENNIDGAPQNATTALMSKLYYAAGGDVR